MRPPHAGSHAQTHGPCTGSFISLGFKFHVEGVGLYLRAGQGLGLALDSHLSLSWCSQCTKTCCLLLRRLLSPSTYLCSCLVKKWSLPIPDR